MVGISNEEYPEVDIFNMMSRDPFTQPFSDFKEFRLRFHKISLVAHPDKKNTIPGMDFPSLQGVMNTMSSNHISAADKAETIAKINARGTANWSSTWTYLEGTEWRSDPIPSYATSPAGVEARRKAELEQAIREEELAKARHGKRKAHFDPSSSQSSSKRYTGSGSTRFKKEVKKEPMGASATDPYEIDSEDEPPTNLGTSERPQMVDSDDDNAEPTDDELTRLEERIARMNRKSNGMGPHYVIVGTIRQHGDNGDHEYVVTAGLGSKGLLFRTWDIDVYGHKLPSSDQARLGFTEMKSRGRFFSGWAGLDKEEIKKRLEKA
ncbi:hypothetical protein NX059_004044 [Plenodomus lindquistii]|nr:hypothetical protein NX059_004044 [Plenodomus lindquistii]